MRKFESDQRTSSLGTSAFVAAIVAVVVAIGAMVWMMSEPTSRTASTLEASKTTGAATPLKAPPASTSTDPATQGASR